MKEIVEELKIQSGEFVLLCGKSGSGKTTLLKVLQKFFEENNLRAGYVMQNFDAQIITDKVWHELSFGLENLGMETSMMRRRVSEVANYFGIAGWLERDTALLSGGQKQLLNLASVMAMTPDVLLLDEPSSQLDPIAAQNFFGTVKKINRELGVTVVIAEHRLDELFAECDRAVLLDEMKIAAQLKICNGKAQFEKSEDKKKFLEFLPVCARVFEKLEKLSDESGNEVFLPLTVAEGRNRLRAWKPEVVRRAMSVSEGWNARPERSEGKPQKILELKEISFRYEKNETEILSDLNLSLNKGEIFAVMGANGSGKSTLLKILCGQKKQNSGRIRWNGTKKVLMVPQNVRNCFAKKTAAEEIEGIAKKEGKNSSLLEMAEKIAAEIPLENHPYDLSGGEMQKLALVKVLLQEPELVLLDEPTKGLDNGFKKEFSEILRKICAFGISVLIVSHDVEFCAVTADRISMMFEGQLAGTSAAKEFFDGNSFYTTSLNRMTRGIFDGIVTERDFEFLK